MIPPTSRSPDSTGTSSTCCGCLFSRWFISCPPESSGADRVNDATQFALEQRVAEQHRHHGKAQFFWVWGALLVMTGFEVYLGYQNMEPVRMLSILMGLSLLKAPSGCSTSAPVQC